MFRGKFMAFNLNNKNERRIHIRKQVKEQNKYEERRKNKLKSIKAELNKLENKKI